jgi:hypothetical protein
MIVPDLLLGLAVNLTAVGLAGVLVTIQHVPKAEHVLIPHLSAVVMIVPDLLRSLAVILMVVGEVGESVMMLLVCRLDLVITHLQDVGAFNALELMVPEVLQKQDHAVR